MRNPNFLILDETTNDLDIITLQILEDYLRLFKGCVIVVSHDRYFMDKVVDHLFVFQGEGRIQDFPGNYTQYRAWKEEQDKSESKSDKKSKSPELKKQKVGVTERKRMSFKERREFEQLEQEIAELEIEKQNLEIALCSGTLSVDELTEKSKRLPLLEQDLEQKTNRWFELGELEN